MAALTSIAILGHTLANPQIKVQVSTPLLFLLSFLPMDGKHGINLFQIHINNTISINNNSRMIQPNDCYFVDSRDDAPNVEGVRQLDGGEEDTSVEGLAIVSSWCSVSNV